MKKLLLTLIALPISLTAQVGPQPLFISNITFNPQGECGANPTLNISVTASGGTPSSNGSYTYQLLETNGTVIASQTTQIADFTGSRLLQNTQRSSISLLPTPQPVQSPLRLFLLNLQSNRPA